MQKLAPLDILGQSLRLMMANARPLAWLAVPYLLMQGWSQVLIYEAEALRQVAEAAEETIRPRPIHGLALLLALWVWLPLNVNVYRLVLGDRSPERQPWAPLRLGWTEARLLGMSLVLGLVMVSPMAAGFLGGLAAGDSPVSAGVIALILLPGAVFVAVRLWMALPAIALDRPSAGRESYVLTEGQVLPLVLTTALLLGFSLAVAIVAHIPSSALHGMIAPEGGVALLLLGLIDGTVNAVLTVLWLVVAAVCYGRLRDMAEQRRKGSPV